MNVVKRIGKLAVCLIFALAIVCTLVPGVSLLDTAYGAVSGAPATEKKLHDNGDGTYTLSLSVTGQAESSSTTQVSKANVVLVVDTSNSMNGGSGSTAPYNYTEYSGAGQQGTQYWGTTDGEEYYRVYWRNNQWRTTNQNNGPVYSGTVYTRSGGQALSRLEAEKDALTKDGGIIDNLLNQNVAGDPNKSDIIEVAVVNFGTGGHDAQDFTTNGDTLKSTINGLTTSTGTNWEEALQHAKAYADTIKASQPDEEVYIIFLTDGEPTTDCTRPAATQHNVNTNYAEEWGYASDDARDIVAAGYNFYGLFTWGSGTSSHYLSSLVQYAYTGSGNSDSELQPAYAQYFTDASDTETLIEALNQIVHDITESVGYTNVELADGVTSMTTSSVSTTASGEVTGIKYYRGGGSYGTYNPDNGQYGTEWADAPEATVDSNGVVDWKLLDENGAPLVLEDGVTYTVTFVVWPNQESTDLVADLNNSVIQYSDLTDDQKSQISVSGGKYHLKTNTDYPTVTYSTVTTTTVDGVPTTVTSDPVTTTITNPEPVDLTEEMLNAKKEWEDTLDPSQREDVGTSVTLYLKVDDDYYYKDEDGNPLGVTLTKDSDWEETDYIAIAPGLMVTEASPAYPGDNVEGVTYVEWDGHTYAILEDGHDYIFKESESDKHFELTAYTHHPMQMGNEIKDVVFTKDASGKITGIESVSNLSDTLSATNTLKGGINITKKVVDENGKEIDNTDPFTVTVTVTDPDGNALPIKEEDGTEYTIDYRIYYGENNPAYATSGSLHRSDHIYKKGTSFEETLYVGDTIRVVNVEDDSIYSVTETAPKGYEYVTTNYSIAYGPGEPDPLPEGETPTVQGNSASYAEVVNKYTFGDLKVSKALVVEGGDEEQAAKKEFTFTFNLYTDDTKATELTDRKYNYTITKADGTESTGTITSGGTFNLSKGDNIIIEKLPEGAYYEVAETDIPDGFELINKVNDTGTIEKNTTVEASFINEYNVEPVSVDPPVKKVITGNEDLYNKGDFTFEIKNTKAPEGVPAPMPDKTEITNIEANEILDKPGFYEFGEIEFTEPGEYIYEVTESGSVLGVTNDSEATKSITFTVTDNGQGKLTVSPATDDAVFEFTNVYKVGELDITKTIVNGDNATLKNFTFTVTLKDAEGKEITGEYPYTVYENGEATETTGTITSGGSVTLTDKQTAKITNIPNGVEYTVVEEEANTGGYATTPATGDATGTIVADEPQIAAFTNTYSVEPTTVSFPVKKELSVPEDLDGPSEWSYTIDVAAQDGAPEADTMTGTVDQDNDTVTFGPIEYTAPGTYTYTVTEKGEVDGVTNDSAATTGKTVTVTVEDDGEGGLTAKASSTEANPLTFTNTYKVEPTTASFPVEKELSVPEDLDGPSEWSYTIDVAAQDGAPEADTMTGTVDQDNTTVTFGPIEYTAPGEYTYTVTEKGEVKGVTNDSAATTGKTVTVTVVDNGDGTLTATASSTTDKPLTFTNTYKVEPTTVSFPVKKEISKPAGTTGPKEWSYDIEVVAKDGAPEAETMSGTVNQDKDTVTFGEFEYTASGTYTYEVTESGEVAGVTNDTEATKTVTVTVVDNGDGTLTATASSTTDKPLTFTNTYEPGAVDVVLNVSKALTGRDLEADDVFDFVLKDGDTVVGTAPNDSAGNVTFTKENTDGALTFDKVGTYVFTITEDKAGDKENGVTFTEKVVTATVAVTDGGKGALVYEVRYDPEDTTFTNDYKATGEVTIKGSKVFKDKLGNEIELKGGEFEFEITNPDGSKQTVENGAGGSIAFDPYTFTLDKDHQIDGVAQIFTVREVGAGSVQSSGVQEQAAPKAEKKSVEKKDSSEEVSTDEPVEETTDAAEEETVEAQAVTEETAEDSADAEGDVAEETEATEAVEETEAAEPEAAATDEEVEFEVEAEGDVIVTAQEISYDQKVYVITVIPSDNKDGTLSFEYQYERQTVSEGDLGGIIKFENTYASGKATVTITGIKELEGRALKDGEFTFELKDSDGKIIDTATNKGSTVSFSPITYNGDDIGYGKTETYTYTVSEVPGSDDTIDYASNTCEVTVTVVENKDGTITAKVTDPESGAHFKFNNKYTPKPGKGAPTIYKKMIGRDLKEGEFTFNLMNNGQLMGTATNDASGKVTFDEMTFEQPGQYTFTVQEVAGNAEFVSYDTNTYTIVAKVSIDEDNPSKPMKVKWDYGGDKLTITNTYNPPEEPDEPTDGTSTGDNTNLLAGLLAMTLSALGLTGAFLFRRREQN